MNEKDVYIKVQDAIYFKGKLYRTRGSFFDEYLLYGSTIYNNIVVRVLDERTEIKSEEEYLKFKRIMNSLREQIKNELNKNINPKIKNNIIKKLINSSELSESNQKILRYFYP